MSLSQDVKIVFMGTPDFAVPCLQRLLDQKISIVAVVTTPDRPAGRGLKVSHSAVKTFALQRGLSILQPFDLNDTAFLQSLQKLNADIFVVVAFRILPPEVFTIPPMGTINLHASLLPKYRGAGPIQWAIINGETKTGVTTFFIDKKVDTGKILLQEEVLIKKNEASGELHDRLSIIGSSLLVKTLIGIANNSLTPQPQQNNQISRAPKITKAMAEIQWQQTSEQVANFIRGMNPVPVAYTFWQGKNIKIYRTHQITSSQTDFAPGSVCNVDRNSGELVVATGDGELMIDELQLQGKRRMKTSEFLRGNNVILSEVLGKG